MAKYRKKPVVIEAIRWDGSNASLADVMNFVGDKFVEIKYRDIEAYAIKTLEGDHRISEGDFIIKGIAGEFYPCKPDIFAKTYEEVV